MVQEPTARPLTVAPDTEQVVGVVDIRVTASPEDAAAETPVAPPKGRAEIAPNVIVCDRLPIVAPWVIGGAAL